MIQHVPGSLVKVRGREWVVLPGAGQGVLMVRPLGGTEDEVAAILTGLEPVESASFNLPDPTHVGDYASCRLLRDALRLGFRSSAGPFRSFARIAVEPKPYQLVPLLMALKLNPIRMLIADDVGVGKTVEAALIARELMDRGECERLAVLCPPHLTEQWQKELSDKFHIDAELVLPSTARRLEKNCRQNESLFDVYPRVVVSIDYIKSDQRCDDFVRACPELVIVDEAHGCSYDEEANRTRHQRYQLVKRLAENADRHLILVTATPHSGNEGAFRSLLGFLSAEFRNLPPDLPGQDHEPVRRKVAAHFVQRRRADILDYLDEETQFPDRQEREETYKLSPEYRNLFNRVLNYARETVQDSSAGAHRQRVRWWSALALLRSLASSPAAAAATLRNRSSSADTETVDEADEVGRREVLDLTDGATDSTDVAPGGESEGEDLSGSPQRSRLLAMARDADALKGGKDAKLKKAADLLKGILEDGFSPIVFCRFIPTAEYVGEELRKQLGKNVTVEVITGMLPPEEREARVSALPKDTPRVLVCTDCLSEGINLQEYFTAVMHYDLSWNPTRHEQREGRVDRFGQPSKTVRTLTYYGIDNQIDGIVLDVLIRKHKKIRSSLGISVPIPADSNAVIEAIMQGVLLRERNPLEQMSFTFFEKEKREIHEEWESSAEREKRSLTMFAQKRIKVEEVARELKAIRDAIGRGADVDAFTRKAFAAYGASITECADWVEFNLGEVPTALREACGAEKRFRARFQKPVDPDVLYLSRTHPIVEGLAGYMLNVALDSSDDTRATRCGVIRTNAVTTRATVLLLRFRYHIFTRRGSQPSEDIAEDCQVVAFEGAPVSAKWLDVGAVEKLLEAQVQGNVTHDQAVEFVQKVADGYDQLRPTLETLAKKRGEELLDAHKRVRPEADVRGVTYEVRPELPPDVLGIYVYLPAPQAG